VSEQAGHTLDYLTPETTRTIRPSYGLHLTARLCALVPVCIGVTTCLLYLLTRRDGYAFFGFVMLFVGALCFAVGIFSLVLYQWQISRSAPQDAAPARHLRNIDLTILLLAVPIAFVCASIGSTAYSNERMVLIIVQNECSGTINSVTLGRPPHSFTSQTIRKGLSGDGSMKMRHARTLHYSIKQGDNVREGTLPKIDGSWDQIDVIVTDDSVTAKGVSW
jgi:hypothetical protein